MSNLGLNHRGYDIDGDGQIDTREMKIAQRLHNINLAAHKNGLSTPSEEEMLKIRRNLGKRIFAEEFICRNDKKLWRYGDIFSGKSKEEAINYIVSHPQYIRLMPYLEKEERHREIRSSRGFRNCLNQETDYNATNPNLYTKTWIRTPRKLNKLNIERNISTAPSNSFEFKYQNSSKQLNKNDDIAVNDYGVVDFDGDGIIDADEMKLNRDILPHKKNLDNSSMQMKGREILISKFIERNRNNLKLFKSIDGNKPDNEIIYDTINKDYFSSILNNLKNEERIMNLKSSNQVQKCLIDLTKSSESEIIQPIILTSRPVKLQSELLQSRIDYNKQLNGIEFGIQTKTKLILDY